MNPSASGWIKKHIPTFKKEIANAHYTEEEFYHAMKENGFVYANSVATISYPKGTTYQLTLEEISKVNLLDGLGFVYFQLHPTHAVSDFIKSANDFYEYLKTHSWFSFHIPGFTSSPTSHLEKVIQKRVQTGESTLQRNFSSLISNALLYLDVLTFEHYLKTENNPADFAKSLEALLANTVYLAFSQKTNKSTHEELVLKLLEISLRYNKIEETSLPFKELDYSLHQNPIERHYILDLACMTIYADEILEENEHRFIQILGKNLDFDQNSVKTSIDDFKEFLKVNKGKITYLDYSNPFRNLYDNTTRMVKVLVIRNRKRLIREIRQSKELVYLLRKSTVQELNDEEREKVKTQLLDICKVVPSLAIFMLPGGSILLPILIKFIPDLLPSAFTDNKAG